MRYVKSIVFVVLVLHALILAGPVYPFSNIQYSSTVIASNSNGVEAYGTYAVDSSVRPKPTVYDGSGFFIARDVVLTCNHLVKGARSIELVYNNKIKLKGTLIEGDDASDLALLKVPGIEALVSPLVLGNSNAMRQGSRVYAIGFPLPLIMGMQPKIGEGIISSTFGFQDDPKTYQISNPVQPGNSGGPLLNEQAQVVGVVSGSLNAAIMMKQKIMPQNVNYAVKINNISNFINYFALDVSFNGQQNDEKILSAADVMDIARKAVVYIEVTH